jgi:outer membrane protein OmpA-like peptidoglycan-associated protein/Tol biopolymer transport system component/Tfp pilus assembly protein PilF
MQNDEPLMFGRHIVLFLLSILTAFNFSEVSAQNRHKAERILSTVKNALQALDDSRAFLLLNECIKADTTYADGWWLKGDLQTDRGNLNEALFAYQKALHFDPSLIQLHLSISQLKLKVGQYNDAKTNAEDYLAQHKGDSTLQVKTALSIIEKANIALEIMRNPLSITLQNLGPEINTSNDEYINSVTADEQTLIFTRKTKKEENYPQVENLYIAHKDSLGWKIAPLQFNTPIAVNAGALCISPDGQTIWFTICGAPDGFGSCDLYVSQRQQNSWSNPLNLGPVINSISWETQPSISSDGKKLYFVSNRPGGVGNADIWVSNLQNNGSWGTPVNLGEPVNTPEDEYSPFIHPDGKTLYFASKGHPGMGGSDLFMTKLQPNGKWTKPINLGYPINTSGDEISLIVNPKGDKAYISSTQKGGLGGFDIYSFTLPAILRPDPVTYIKGIVTDAETKDLLSARFELTNLATGKVENSANSSDFDGSFLLCLQPEKEYSLTVSHSGYLFYSQHFSISEIRDANEPTILAIQLHRIKKDNVVILNNVFFETGSYVLLERSVSELNRLVELLKNNPTLKIKISGYTDNQGDDNINQPLSENRAKAVVLFLIKNGISPSRLTYAGFGKTKPIDTNDTEVGRAKNRRTEFIVIEN